MSLNSILSIPHIIEEITQCLEIHDIVKFTFVCRQWHFFFNPIIWRKPRRPTKGQMETATLLKYQSHIKTIDSPFITQKISDSFDSGWMFRNLNKIHFDFYYYFDDDPEIQTAQRWFQCIQGIEKLRELDVEVGAFHPVLHTLLLNTLNSLPMLKSFKIFICTYSKAKFPTSCKLEIIKACSHLQSLSFIDKNPVKNSMLFENEQSNTSVESAFDNIHTNIKTLNIRFNSQIEETTLLIPLLEKLDNLRSLTLHSEFRPETVANIARVLKSGTCDNLEELHLRVFHKEVEFSTELAIILGAYKDAFDEKSCTSYPVQGLRSLSLDNGMKISRAYIQSISTLQLTNLVLIDTTCIDVPLFSELMHTLPTLKAVQVSIWGNYHFDRGYFIENEDDLNEWTCLDLVDLKIVANRHIVRTVWSNRLEDPYDFMFQQIGRLTKLTELDVTTKYHDILSIKEHGYLPHLSGLKQLRSLIFTCYKIGFGGEDAQWMLDNWPRLIHLHGVESDLEESFKSKLSEGRAYMTVLSQSY